MTAQLDIYSYKQKRLKECVSGVKSDKKVGLISGLGMSEQLPFWASFFENLGFEVKICESATKIKICAQNAAKVCLPAKLVHGSIESLFLAGADLIFMPCESFDIDEHYSINNCSCSILAYYPEILRVIRDDLTDVNFLTPYINLNAQKGTASKLYTQLKRFGVKRKGVKNALLEGIKRLESYRRDIIERGSEILKNARKEGKRAVLLAGRPCHFDSVICSGINGLLTSMNFAVLAEDSLPEDKDENFSQWTYQTRLLRAAEYAVKEDITFLHLISKGCKLDEMVAAQVRAILEKGEKNYTQIKLDESRKNLKHKLAGLFEI